MKTVGCMAGLLACPHTPAAFSALSWANGTHSMRNGRVRLGMGLTVAGLLRFCT